MSNAKITNLEISLVTPILKRLIWASKETRARVQKSGVNVLPVNFYSNTPSIEEIENSYEYEADNPPYLDPRIFEENRIRQTLENLINFASEFNPPLMGNEENPNGFFWKNSQFSYSDAVSYYCFIRMTQPASIVEIGSGFSTLIALDAVEKNKSGRVHCIEPFPRDFLKIDQRISLYPVAAQEIKPEFLNDTLRDGDILFIDSTHTVKCGSDCLHIYLRLLPTVRRNILVHVHDVFLPFGMPKEWLLNQNIYWTEQYLLLAFLIDNPKAALIYGSAFNAKWNSSLMEKLMNGQYPFGGGSVWFRYNGNS